MKTTACYIFMFLAFFCNAELNQVIIQLDDKVTIQQLKMLNLQSPFTSPKLLSKTLNIWLIEILSTQMTLKKETTLLNWQKHPQIKVAQLNEEVDLRNRPNDLLFNEQWQYNNKGEANGITDTDIDALKAWQHTTGGRTVNEDEIVVAVIDGGVDLNHPDLVNNLWTNLHEIPNNKIDDDQNGYIDDYYGWNFNDTIPDVGNASFGHWHGTPVTGIIGAEGNNYEGVCGVNWHLKIMTLIANQTVADVIAAYDYALEMRKRYNETNGKEGAFVVATNASLGINEGKPVDHPLWCAIYDALGEAGILSVAATANNFINVDERGDLPTTCNSNFLISVTSTNNRDELQHAAFGRQHIDLSAPGSGIFTTTNNGEYGTFGGTSAAAPHVAGAVALLYASTNINLMKAIQSDPAAAALLVKDFILDGTEPLADLYNKSASNGRLNLFNSLCTMENYFNDNNCIETKEVSLQIDEIQLSIDKKAIHIYFDLEGQTYLKVRLIDSAGRLVSQQYLTNINTGKHQILLPAKKLKTGMYYAVINSKKGAVSKSVLVL